MKRFLLYILLLLPIGLAAQNTKIKGLVTDASTNEALPFASVYFPGTTVGVTTDFDGYYYLETRQAVPDSIYVELMGYKRVAAKVNVGGFNELNFSLEAISFNLKGVTVKADDKKIRSFMKKLCDKKPYNNPDEYDKFNCKIYSKMELDLTNINPQMKNKVLQKNFGFVFENMDTSVVSGQPYLPVMITESNVRYYHQKRPPLSREIIDASRISGIKEDYSLAQFTGHLHAKINLYENYLDIFNVRFASPLSDHGFMYYNYYMIDSMQVNGRKTYKLRFHPKMHSAPVLDGEFNVDSTTMALQQAHVKMVKGVNVNWVRDMVIDVQNQIINDSIWFYKQDKLYIDFSVTMNDSSKVISFLGNRQVNYSNINLNEDTPPEVLKLNNNVIINENVLNNDEQYWKQERPYELTQKEQRIYDMVDSIKRVPLYNNIYNIVTTFITGYYDLGKIEIGPYYKLFSFNNLEGARFQFGARTTSDLSKKIRLSGHIAYGTKDNTFKGGGSFEYSIGRQPTRKLSLAYKRDALQLGAGEDAFTEGNILGSLLSKGNSQRLSLVNRGTLSYEHEWSDNVTTIASAEVNRVSSNKYVQMFTPDSTAVSAVRTATIGLSARFGWNEIINRDYFDKTYIMSDYPVITLDFKMGLKGIWKNGYDFYRAEAGLKYDLSLPPLGTSYLRAKAGKIWGTVPYPMLKLHEGNGTYFNSPGAFACMDFYEFASDCYVQWFYEHNFKGFFLGKIPLLKKLKWREVVSFRGVYGTVSDKNNGSEEYIKSITDANGNISSNAKVPVLLFPKGMSSVNKPYLEAGVGITNIFRIFRVDSYWRLNHRHNYLGEKNTSWVINFGMELIF